ncbi:MAG: response regulator [Clostridiaceae bacterium]|nr:response regulator [Clostridiaceae bacterium]
MKALIVDDDHFVRKGLTSMIPWSDLGFDRVLEADNGLSALKQVKDECPDLILTDVLMPVMDGIEFCRLVREQDYHSYIIMLSAYDDFEYARSALRYRVSEYILKPLTDATLQELKEKISVICVQIRQEQHFYHNLYSRPDLINEIDDIIKSHDQNRLDNLFHDVFPELGLREGNHSRYFCLFLVDTLSKTLKSMGYSQQMLNDEKENEVKVILSNQSASQTYQYVYEKFCSALHREKPNMSNNQILINNIKDYVGKHYNDDNLSIGLIAEYFHLVSPYLGTVFKEHEGISLNAYISEIRIGKACALLQDSSCRVHEIGRLVGITDPNYFAKLFRKMKGMSPKEYRMFLFDQPNHQDEMPT